MAQIKKVTMKDIAQELDISIVTVSKALAGKEGVGDRLREVIIDKAKELGYIFKKNEDGENVNRNVGILIAQRFVGDDSFYLSVYQKMLVEMTKRGIVGILEVIIENDEKNKVLPTLLSINKVDHIIVLGEVSREYLQALEATGKNIVFFDFENEDFEFDSVVGDNINGGYLMTRHLMKQGYTDITFVGNYRSTRSILDRYLGYRKYMLMKGIDIREEDHIDDRDDEGNDLELVLPDKMPDAFFCNCDVAAYRLIEKLNKAGYKVPEDVAVAGYDDYASNKIEGVELTTYRVNIEEMIYYALNILEQKFQNPDYRYGTVISYGRVIARESTKPPAAGKANNSKNG
ncbi:MAG: LacI family DNA-binding transcriptional regulator [Eubacterium sp.]|nr:LacI family DNA-binding transcriptional regulator [Eubacterium sp.]